MAASREDITRWLARAKEEGATHLIVACDTFDWEDYPVLVKVGQDARKIAAEHNGPNMQKLMEVYNMSQPIDAQMQQHRAMNY